jgi:hypothetical protein
MARSGINEADVADLVRRCQDAATALIRGDVGSYLDLFVHADDYTLVPPFGGAPRHGFDDSEEAVEQLSRFFAGGEAQVDVMQSYVSGDCVLLVLLERQHGTGSSPATARHPCQPAIHRPSRSPHPAADGRSGRPAGVG